VTDPRRAPRRPSTFLLASAALHLGAAGLLAAFPGWWRAVVATLVADHMVFGFGGLFPRSALLGPNVCRLPPGDRVALTFDDGPDPEVTPSVLARLAAHGARASFFCVGSKVERHPDLARAIRDGGHEVENHTHLHSNLFAFLGPAAMSREIGRAQDAIECAVGRRPALFRAPAGMRSFWVDPVVSILGLRLVSWTRRGFDTVDRDTGRVATRLATGLAPGDILLLHDGSKRRDAAGHPVLLGAVSAILEEASRRGLACVPVDEALRGAER
jgi:peptidoglycan/xylan/chitin deacetylase (PgdA/CDA1 family)